MPRLARRSAGDRVVGRAQRLSDALLRLEDTEIGRCERLLVTESARAVRVIEQAWRRDRRDPARLLADGRLKADLTKLHRHALEQTVAPIETMAGRVANMTLVSIGEELALCERTLAARYAGVAEAGMTYAESMAKRHTQTHLAKHREYLTWAGAMFDDGLGKQLAFAAQRKETVEQVVARLTSRTPVGLLGCKGRGIWMQSQTSMAESVRGVSIGLMNSLRIEAMNGMNAAGEMR